MKKVRKTYVFFENYPFGMFYGPMKSSLSLIGSLKYPDM